MSPEELIQHLTSLEAALALAEAIVEPARQAARGWDLAGWTCEIAPGSVRFLYHGEGGRATAAVLVVQPLAGDQPSTCPPRAVDDIPATVVRFGRTAR